MGDAIRRPKKTIGILGGSGPLATSNFFSDVIAVCQEKYGAEQDTDFPKIYLSNIGLNGFDETGFKNLELVKKQLIQNTKELELWGADFIVMPCNTIHYFIHEMQKDLKIPIISILDATINKIKKTNFKKIGIISSNSTRALGLYKDKLLENGFETNEATDTEQAELDNVVLKVMSGNQGNVEKKILQDIINRMSTDKVDAVILGCTELPLAIAQQDTPIPLFNTIHILAENAVDYSYE